MFPRSDQPAPIHGVRGAELIVYSNEDVSRMLAEVERRSGRCRKHRERAAQMAACLAVALVAWLTQSPTANGEVRSGYQPAAVSTIRGGLAAPPGV